MPSPGSATTPTIGCALLTGAGDKAFCSGGDQRFKDRGGYVGGDGLARLNVLDLQRQIRSLPIPVIALVNGYAIGGGQVLQVVCDLAIAGDNAIFGQVGPQVGSFDAGFGIGLLARLVGDRKAQGDLVPVPPLRRAPRRSRWGSSTTSCRSPSSRPRASSWARRDPGHEPDRDPLPEVGVPRRYRRAGRAPGVRRQRDRPVLHDRRGAGGLDAPSSRSARPTSRRFPRRPGPVTDRRDRPQARATLPDLAARHPAGDPARGAERRRRRARARRSRSGRRSGSIPRSAASPWRCCSRSRPTCPTTCPISARAPTRPTGPARSGSRRPGW